MRSVVPTYFMLNVNVLLWFFCYVDENLKTDLKTNAKIAHIIATELDVDVDARGRE